MATTTPITLAASAARTASGTGSVVDLGNKTTIAVVLAVSAISGTGARVAVMVSTSKDQTVWRELPPRIGQLDAVGVREHTVPGCDRYVRVAWTIEGTGPSVTFSVSGVAKLVYATPADLDTSIPGAALANLTPEQKDDALTSATDLFSAELASGGYTLPLVSWGNDLRQRVCDVAAYFLLKRRGFNPETGADQIVVKAYDDAVAWGKRIAAEALSPPDIVDSTVDTYDGGAVVVTRPKRGWG